MTALDKLTHLVGYTDTGFLDAHYALDAGPDDIARTILGERDTEIVAWLGKKAKEFRAAGGKQRQAQADAVHAMASKLMRGAVRPDNMRGVVTRNEVLNEAADLIEAEQHRLDDAENARHGALDHESELQHTAVHAMGALLRRVAAGKGTREGESTQPANPDECTCMPHRKFRCGHCEMDLCQDCGQCCGCDCAKGGE